MNLRRSISRLAFLLVLLPAPPAAADVRQLALPTNDIVYDRLRDKIYASVPSRAGMMGNSVTVIDPESGTIGASVFVGSEPDKLAISDDGRYLYAVLDGAGAVRRLDLATLSPGLQFSLGGSPRGPFEVDDMEVMPGHPETVAISRDTGGTTHEGVVIYDNGIARPETTPGDAYGGPVAIEFSSSPSRLYGHSQEDSQIGFRRMTVDDSGVSYTDPAPVIGGLGRDITYDAGLIYSTQGLVVEPEMQLLVGTFIGPSIFLVQTMIAPDSSIGRVFFLTGEYEPRTLLAFEQQTFLPVGSMPVPATKGRLGRLIRWGLERSNAGGGLAFRTDMDQLFLIRTPLIPAEDLVLTFTPRSVRGGGSVTGRIDLRGAAPPGGLTIPLSSDHPAVAAVPNRILVPEGATAATFPVRTAPVQTAATVTVSAAFHDRTWQAALPVLPVVSFALSLETPSLGGSESTTGLLTLSAPAPPGGVTVTLSSDDPVASVPDSVTIPAGATTARFPITTQYVTQYNPVLVKITATYGEFTSTGDLTVLPLTVALLALHPNDVVGGDPVIGTVQLNVPAPPGGVVVQLFSGDPSVVSMPPSVRVETGQITAAFSVTTYPTPDTVYTQVSAMAGDQTRWAALIVLPPVPHTLSVTLAPDPIVGGLTGTGTVTLESPALDGGVTVALSSSRPDVARVPATAQVAVGSSIVLFPVVTAGVRVPAPVTLSATVNGDTKTALLTVLRAGITAFSVQPGVVVGGHDATGTVTLDNPASAGGAVLTLVSDKPDVAILPQQISVPAGALNVSFRIQTNPVSAATAVRLTTSYAGESRTASLTVQPR